jgi:hypothetical protein
MTAKVGLPGILCHTGIFAKASISHAFVTRYSVLSPFALEPPCTETLVIRIIAREMTVLNDASFVDMSALGVPDLFSVAHGLKARYHTLS